MEMGNRTFFRIICFFIGILVNIPAYAYDFQSNGIYYNVIGDNEVEVTKGDNKYRGDVVLPASVFYDNVPYTVVCIGGNAFNNCSNLTSLFLPNSLTTIGDNAFFRCSGLVILTLPNSLTTIGEYAFYGCNGLTSLSLPNSLITIGDGAFCFCSNLTSLSLPNSLKTIGEYAFYECRGLTSLTLPVSVTNIGSYAFSGCNCLTSVVSEIQTPFTIAESVFSYNTYNEARLTVPIGTKSKYQETNYWSMFKNIEEKQKSDNMKRAIHVATAGTLPELISDEEKYMIEELILTGELNSTDFRLLRDMAGNNYLGEFTTGKLSVLDLTNAKVVEGGEKYLDTDRIRISKSISISGDYHFEIFKRNEIPQYVFISCKLKKILIPNSVMGIGSYAFAYSNSITSVVSEIQTPFTISDNVFSSNTYAEAKLTVPVGTKSKYQETNYWNKFKNIEESSSTIDYSKQYLTFESEVDNNFFIFHGNQQDIAYNRTVQYSTDGGQTWTSLYDGDSVSANSGDIVLLKATGLTPSISDGIGTFEGMNYYKVYGNIMSLVYGDDFAGQTTIGDNQFKKLFLNDTNLTDAENLILPSTTVKTGCYDSMFKNCISLTVAPSLPATSLATNCYMYMFQGCTSLTTTPELPAATLAYYCYRYMFNGCTSLTTAPELPATTLGVGCYQEMFSDCTSLTTAPVLPATTLAYHCYSHMFARCSSLVNAPSLPATSLIGYCYHGMFRRCTSLVNAPSLPATTLADYCYCNMFDGCSSLTVAPTLPAMTLADYCYASMFANCTSLVNAPALPATTLADGCYSHMFDQCYNLTTASELPATTLAPNCYNSMYATCRNLTTPPSVLPATTLVTDCYAFMFSQCLRLTTAPTLPATTLAEGCYQYMFQTCRLATAPDLPATTLVDYCYQSMFQNCTFLNYIKCLATDISATDCTTDWLRNTYSSGTFVKNTSMSSWTTGDNGIPSGWSVIDSGGGINPTQEITVTADNFTREYGDVNPAFTYTSSGGTLNGTPKISCSATKTSPVGTYTIKIDQGSVTNSDVTYVDGTLTITKAPLIITAKSYTRKQGEANPTFEVEYSGFKNGETESVLTKRPTASTTATTNSPVGTYDINVAGAEAQNYSITYVNGKLTITEKDNEIFTLQGISYSGSNSSLKAEVVAVDNGLTSVEIPSSVSYNGKTYQVTFLTNGILSNRTFDYVSLPSTITSLATNTFSNSMLGAFIWNANSSLSSGVFNNMAMTTKSNFLLYVNQKSYAPTNVTNVIVGTSASSITLADGTNTRFYCPKEFTAQSISYTHFFSMTTGGNGQGWESIVLPFDVQRISHSTKGEIVPFAAYNANDRSQRPFWLYRFGTSGFVRSSSISANTPYIIAMPNNTAYDDEYILAGDVTFSATNVTVKPSSQLSVSTSGGKTFTPAYRKIERSSSVYALNVNNRNASSSGGYDWGSRFIGNLRDVYPFEAYMLTSSAEAREFIEIEFEDEVTGLDGIPMRNDSERKVAVYSISGQLIMREKRDLLDEKLHCLPSGIYIVDGNKTVVQ